MSKLENLRLIAKNCADAADHESDPEEKRRLLGYSSYWSDKADALAKRLDWEKNPDKRLLKGKGRRRLVAS